MAWQTATSSYAALYRWVLVSAVLHWLLIGFGGTAPLRPGVNAGTKIHVMLRPFAMTNKPAAPESGSQPLTQAVHDRRSRSPAAAPVDIAANLAAGDSAPDRRAPRDEVVLDLARFDPAEYLPPSAVERTALPINQELFDVLPLSGGQSGLWLVRLFVDEHGRVVEVELVESSGSEHNAQELKAILLANRFLPALRPDGPVKSQKMVEISFEPGPEAQATVPVPVPSAAGK